MNSMKIGQMTYSLCSSVFYGNFHFNRARRYVAFVNLLTAFLTCVYALFSNSRRDDVILRDFM